jgi:hypothetical protein
MKTAALIASSPTLEGIQSQVSRFYGGSTVTLAPRDDDTWTVATGRGVLSSVIVRKVGKRYRFEMV